MRDIEGVSYLTDENGRRLAAQLDLETYGEQLEDFFDELAVQDAQEDESVPLEKAREYLVKQGKLREPVRGLASNPGRFAKSKSSMATMPNAFSSGLKHSAPIRARLAPRS